MNSRPPFAAPAGALLLFVFAWLLASCRESPPPAAQTETAQAQSEIHVDGKPLHPRSLATAATRFTSLPPEDSGLQFVNPVEPEHPLKRLYAGGYAAGGIAIGDVTGDGMPDVYCVSGPQRDRLFVQTAELTFEDRTDAAGLLDDPGSWETGAALADIDDDGDLDLYVCRYDAPNVLFINDGQGHFEEKGAAFGVDVSQASLMPSFADYDGDGDLDLYILTNFFYRENGMPTEATFLSGNNPTVKAQYRKWIGIRPAGSSLTHKHYELYPVGQRDILLRNDRERADGAAPFKDVSGYAGDIGVAPGKGLSATWWDYNEDGYPDLYVCNDFEDADNFYHNNGDGTFTDIIASAMPHTPWYSMGSDVADFNQDGRLDLFALDMAATSHFKQKTAMGDMSSKQLFMESAIPRQYMRNSLFLNTGTPHFQEAAHLAGLASSDWSWAAKAGDFDNDGLTDVFITNGMARAFTNSDILRDITYRMRFGKTDWDLFADKPPQKEVNLAFRNRGNLDFAESGAAWGLAHKGMSYAAASGDLDRDGDLDLIVANLDEPIHLYRNDTSDGNRLLIALRGTESHSSGLGALVAVEANGRTFVRQMNPYTGYLSSNDPVIHVGLGPATVADEITVRWPRGQVQTLRNVAVNQWLTIEEPAGEHPAAPEISPATPALFARADSALPEGSIRHTERPYDDFARQPLLPNKLSQLGPGLAVADLDQNGAEDFYLGGAAGYPGQLVLRSPDGSTQVLTAPFLPDREAEDMAGLFFDGNGDGHLDLYVVSGGVECEPGDPRLRDRFYRGDGRGGLVKTNGVLPDLRDSGAAAAAADFDRDGDIDLFVGGRSIPGDYPLSPTNRLLINAGDRFENKTTAGLEKTGLVTGALWSDADNDGWLDLLLTHEWGAVKLFRNENGALRESEQTGLSALTGWWNSITAGDIDHDGDMDYAVMNAGLNSKYHASPTQPALLYYGDFENDGRMHLVEAEFENETLFPVRGRSCSSRAMPHLGDKFKTYQGFALATLEEVFPQEKLRASHRFAATTLESGILLNDGTGSFAFRALPRIAQLAPAYGATLTDLNGDGHVDLYLLQNFFGPQLETGRMNGGLSQLLLGNGEGGFSAPSPDRSGLIVPGDATALALLDLNRDHAPDLLVAQNDGPVLAFTNNETDLPWHTLTLSGPLAIGARVEIRVGGQIRLATEIAVGGGYLSQSSATLFCTLPAGPAGQASVRWADGQTTMTELDPTHANWVIAPPDRQRTAARGDNE